MDDFKNLCVHGQSIVTQNLSADANGAGIDMTNVVGPVHAVLSVGATTGTGETMNVKLQESDDDSTYTDIEGATFEQIVADATGVYVISVHNRRKRYVRAVADLGGTTPTFLTSVTLHGKKIVA